MLIAARNSQDFACCARATESARSKYACARIITQSAASKALDTSVRKLSCLLCLCEDVRMTSAGNDDRLDAQDPTRRRLLPLWPNLVVSRSRDVHVVDLRQRFQRTDFVEADHDMSG